MVQTDQSMSGTVCTAPACAACKWFGSVSTASPKKCRDGYFILPGLNGLRRNQIDRIDLAKGALGRIPWTSILDLRDHHTKDHIGTRKCRHCGKRFCTKIGAWVHILRLGDHMRSLEAHL